MSDQRVRTKLRRWLRRQLLWAAERVNPDQIRTIKEARLVELFPVENSHWPGGEMSVRVVPTEEQP